MKIRIICVLLTFALWWSLAFAGNDPAPVNNNPLGVVYEWIAKGLLVFLLVDIWRNQKTLFKGQDDLSKEISEIKGFCKGKNKDC
jgi:hypothetical protein